MRIVLDCDDVLADFVDGLGKTYNQRYGTRYNSDDFGPDPANWVQLLGSEGIKQMYVLFNNGELAWNLKPVPGSLETIRQLHAHGDELFVVTSRNHLPLHTTPRWLEREYGKIIQDVFYAKLTPDDDRPTKGEICQRLNADLAVDDLARHAEDISSYGIPCLLYNRPWNREYAEKGLVTRVLGHEGVREQVEKMRRER